MLVEFSVANYLSFKDRVTLSLVASNDSEHEENTFETPGRKPLRLLKSVGIYGANASGKSNFVKALRFVARFIHGSAARQPTGKISVVPFKLDPDTLSRPSEFEVVFIHDDQRYTYSFAADAERVHEESLTAARLGGEAVRERLLFQRSAKAGYDFGATWRGGAEKIASLTRHNALFLSVAAQFNSLIAEPLVGWFGDQFKHIGDEPELGSESKYTTDLVTDDEEMKKALVMFLQRGDPGIHEVSIKVVPLRDHPRFRALPSAERAKYLSQFPEGADAEVADVETIHRTSDQTEVRLDLEREGSAGTRRLYALYGPWAYVWTSGSVLCVDEIERKLHPLLTRALVDMLHRSEHSQLVFTTHDCGLLDAGLLRRDQIWFTEKDSGGATDLYSLWDYKVRKDENYGKGYLAGRYGAIPFVGDFEFEGN